MRTVRQVAKAAGTSVRTLHHYDAIGLLKPGHVGTNGYRYYGPNAVARLQRILLLRDTGMPLTEIAAALEMSATPETEIEALTGHLDQLAKGRETLDRRINAVQHTLEMRRRP